jgi:hypothetical protein
MEPSEQPDPAGKSGFFASLVYRDYRRLWIATACGQASHWALVVLRAALVYELTRSNAWVGFVTMAAHLPSLVVTPWDQSAPGLSGHQSPGDRMAYFVAGGLERHRPRH